MCINIPFTLLLLQEWNNRAALPTHVVQMLNNFPSTLHPMAQFGAAITACNSESKFSRAYAEGVKKSSYWEVSNNCVKTLHGRPDILILRSVLPCH